MAGCGSVIRDEPACMAGSGSVMPPTATSNVNRRTPLIECHQTHENLLPHHQFHQTNGRKRKIKPKSIKKPMLTEEYEF
ncbi:hypothetical protein COLO4_24498 [Corchorus olitorius]|uniref:Uncharacterized protein n=1 Tax=Corchorus olitorius TaxID=93759 RepID=A0A1R3I9H3_9ROSI|nr:hypothetical protein COLO4_24498 [Corchorus olitorius]